MTQCRECNSEIEEDGSFCPFCGIPLEPVAVGVQVGDSDETEGNKAAESANGESTEKTVEEQSGVMVEEESEIRERGAGPESVDTEDDPLDSSSGSGASPDSPDELTTEESNKVEDAEIDRAVSVIDEKADLWREKDIDQSIPADSGETEMNGGEAAASAPAYEMEAGDTDIDNEILETVVEEKEDSSVQADSAFEDDTLIDISARIQADEANQGADASDEDSTPDAVVGDIEDGSLSGEPATALGSSEASPKPSTGNSETESDDPATNEEGESEEAVDPVITDLEESNGEPQAEGPDLGDVSEFDTASEPEDAKAPESGEDSELATSDDEPPLTTPNIGGGDTDGSKVPKLQPLDEGTVLNERYEIVRKIGGGGMGAVYLASDKNLGGVLRAVKEMVQSYIEIEQQEKAIQDFKRESMLLTSLEHPAIPTIYDYFFAEKEARFYLVMKYISGGDLAARLRSAPEGRLDELSVTRWAIEIADVLDYLHNRQPPIVYRDLKPANIMIDGNSSKIMLIDFGIARWINKEEKGVTAVGTMGYAPPELFSGNIVPSSDIYSLGSTMFHLLTGADPQNNPLLIFDFQKHPRPRQINPNLSDEIEQILMKTVEYNADLRFISASQLRDELERHLARLTAGQVSYGIKKTPKSVALSDQPVFCGFCGQKIVATDMFCAFCGAKQPLAQPGVQSQEYTIPQTTARLIVVGTDELDIPSFDLGKKENLVGRRDPMSNIFPEVDLSKYDPQTKISRKHARIWREGEGYMVEDLGSSNGTVIIQTSNETTRLAPHQSRPLTNGDKIQVGDTTLHFVLG